MQFECACSFCGMSWNGGLGIKKPGEEYLRFCKRTCLQAWEAKVSFSNTEIEAIEKMLPAMGEFIASSDMGGKAFNDLSRDEALGLFANTIKIFRATFHEVLGNDVPF